MSVYVCVPNWPDIHYAFYARQQRTDRQADWERDWTGCWSFNAFAAAAAITRAAFTVAQFVLL